MHRLTRLATIAALALLIPRISAAQGPRIAAADGPRIDTADGPRSAAAHGGNSAEPIFLLLAPDRGFLGNEEARELHAAFKEIVPESGIAFATVEKARENLEEAVEELRVRFGDRELVVLPLFMSTHEALYRNAAGILSDEGPSVFAEPFGSSYLAEEIFFDRIEELSARPSAEYVMMLADGAGNEEDASAIREDLSSMLDRAVHKYGLAGGEVAVLHGRSSEANRAAIKEVVARIRSAAEQHDRVLLVPMNFGIRLTNMMSHWNWVQMGLHGVENVASAEFEIADHESTGRWLVRTANAYRPLDRDEIGVILVPHGSDYNWNETMREGFAPLRDEYVMEEAFSMVDPLVVERAVRRLEDRGMKAAVVLRVFSLESSFRDQAEYVLGLRREMQGHGGMHGHGNSVPHRIESHLLFTTLGGLEADPHFARALVDRIHEISEDPSTETVILLGHGTGDDAANEHWMQNLGEIAEFVQANDPNTYRDIQFHTWREDWPEKRAKNVPEIRRMIEEANADGGTALVIPVRTAAQGPAREIFPDLEFRYGRGFAPHPEFTAWAREKIEEGISRLTNPALRLELLASE